MCDIWVGVFGNVCVKQKEKKNVENMTELEFHEEKIGGKMKMRAVTFWLVSGQLTSTVCWLIWY